jgi:DNA-binding beta-propeller fold protein YncE
VKTLLVIAAAAVLSIGTTQAARGINIGGMASEYPPGGPGHGDGPCGVLDSCPALETMPGGVAWDGTHVWVGYFSGTSTIYKVDPQSCAIVHSIPAPDLFVGGLAWDGSALWCVPEQSGMIYQLDPTDGTVISSIPAPSFGQFDPDAAGLAWDGQYLWHADYGHQTLYKLDPSDGSVVASFSTPAPGPSGVGYFPGIVVLADFVADVVFMIDSTTGSVISSCEIEGSPDSHPWGLAVADRDSWCARLDNDFLYLLDTQIVSPVEATTWGMLKGLYR